MAIPAAVYVLFKHEIKNFVSIMLVSFSVYVIYCELTLTKGQTKVLATDYLAIALALTALMITLYKAIKTNARLERENAWLRSRVHSMRKQIATMVERPF